ncbi:MAG: hypothetical protein JMDDDDMK_05141 [Acidobacteria bacterium]|nr:hypothetical protein [Acidobacteriota bacterium]
MSAVRHSNRNATNTAITSRQPISSALRRFLSATSMKVAGRKIVESISTSFKPGRSALSAASTLRDTSSVLPVGCFSTISSRPGPSLMIASPMGGGNPSITSATALNCSGAPLRKATGMRARSCGCATADICATDSRWLGVSTKPPAATETASRVERTTSSSVTLWLRSRSGSTST